MLVLRATQKVLRYLPTPVNSPGESDTALGDWFVNRLVVNRSPLLLLVSSSSLLAVLVPARDVRALPARLALIVSGRLKRLGIPGELVEAETRAAGEVVVAKTNNRSVIGSMNDFANLLSVYLEERSYATAEKKLAETPCLSGRRIGEGFYPGRRAAELLERKWKRSPH